MPVLRSPAAVRLAGANPDDVELPVPYGASGARAARRTIGDVYRDGRFSLLDYGPVIADTSVEGTTEVSSMRSTKTLAGAPAIDIGISDRNRAAIAGGLSKLLADTYTLYLTTHNFHWNVTGPQFNTLHTMFMAQYTELWNAVDPIAERIRSLGHWAPGSYAQFGALASLRDAPKTPPGANEMIRILVDGHESVARTARQVFPLAEKASDQPTADLLTQRLDVHEKTAWMLRSLLAG
jgi:starvation-inducible DNA-binding protein